MRWFSAPLVSCLVLAACSGGTSDDTDKDTDTDTDGVVDTDTTADTDTDEDTVDDTDDTDASDDTDLGPLPGVLLTLANGDFESQGLSAGSDRYQGYTGGSLLIPGWTNYIGNEFSGVGVSRPAATSFSAVEPLAAPANGNHAGYLDGRGGGLEDETNAILIYNVDATVAAGDVIHARLAFGSRLDDQLVKPHRTVKMEIVLDAVTVVSQVTVTMPPAGEWKDVEITYEATEAITSFQVRAVAYTLDMTGSAYWQTYVDNLRVSVE